VTAAAQAPSGRLRRDPKHGIVAGVIAGFANRLRVDPVLLRVAFGIAVVATGGILLIAYGVAWATMPAPGERPAVRLGSIRLPGGGGGWRVAAGAGLLMLAALLVFRQLGIWWSDPLVWPLVLAAAGAALLWRQSRLTSGRPLAEEAPAAPGSAARSRSPVAELYRGGFAIALVVGAALLFLSANHALGAAGDAALTAVVVIVALALILAPFLWRLGRSLAVERAERIRSQERAELAAHLHDSVLQTLTLMQKRADDPQEVAALARRQERELRTWLGGNGSPPAASSFAAALRAAAEDVEDAHRVTVEVVAVGDIELDDAGEAVVAAAREALTNAAKFAPDAGAIAVYAEADEDRLQVFVHDRGPGFDVRAVPDDRRGVRESIVGRMKRHGGRAEVRSGPGEGTEVELILEREQR
jgi:signal transduction histidine kinase/phage shock protein PspC (stress-responsive transcriptional regulator)